MFLQVGNTCRRDMLNYTILYCMTLNVLDWIEFKALCMSAKFFQSDFVHQGTVMFKQERAFPKTRKNNLKPEAQKCTRTTLAM